MRTEHDRRRAEANKLRKRAAMVDKEADRAQALWDLASMGRHMRRAARIRCKLANLNRLVNRGTARS